MRSERNLFVGPFPVPVILICASFSGAADTPAWKGPERVTVP